MADYEAAELEYLDLRKKLKDHYRKQIRGEYSTSDPPLAATTETKDVNGDFGSFFGPSQPSVNPRVIKDTTYVLQLAVARMSNPRNGLKKVLEPTSAAKIVKPNPRNSTRKDDPVKVKSLQKKKEARDYSFLLSDDDARVKPPGPKKVSAPNPGRTSAEIIKKDRPVSSSEQKPTSSNPKICGRETKTGSNIKVAPKMETVTLKKKVTIKFGKLEFTSSNAQTVKKPEVSSLKDCTKKRPLPTEDVDGVDYRREIRKMFGYDPSKYKDESDTRDMEAGFHDILKEERTSALIARKEDQIELKRIEEEERKERMKKPAKRPKLSIKLMNGT